MRVFIGMETSGMTRRAFEARGHFVVSCDILPAVDGSIYRPATGGHVQGDVFDTLARFAAVGLTFDLGVFHPDCTYLTNSAAWAFNEPDFARWPGVGYHQRVKPGTLTGEARARARREALATVRRIMALPLPRIAIENPVGAISTAIRKPDQIIQPYDFGDDASKATCLWLHNLRPLLRFADQRVAGRRVEWPRGSGKTVERWANQTDSGQNALSPSDERWKTRSVTYPGISAAMARTWGKPLHHFNDLLQGGAAECRAA